MRCEVHGQNPAYRPTRSPLPLDVHELRAVGIPNGQLMLETLVGVPMTYSARDLAAATPIDRDRYVDLLRVVALAVVMLGHFFMVGVQVDPDGAVEVTNSLTVISWAQWLTWFLQVMPVFFAVGGFSNAVAWTSYRRRGGTYADFMVSRADRLLRPTVAFISTGLVVGVAVEASGHLDQTAIMVLRVIAQPLWFIGIYLAVVALAPSMYALHRRWGWRALALLVLGTVGVDVLRFGLGAPEIIGYLNFAFVWLAVQQCGFFYADRIPLLDNRRFVAVAAIGSLALTVALVVWGPYPVSMVTLPGESVSNMTPPSLALLSLSFWLMGLALLLRAAATALLGRKPVWRATIAANGVPMTSFLWHFTVIVAVTGLLVLVGAPVFPTIGSTTWWLLRLPLLVVMASVLFGVVVMLRRFERPTPWQIPDVALRRRHRNVNVAVGAGLALLGILGFSVAGFAGVLTLRTATLVVMPMSALPSALILAAGYGLMRWSASPSPATRHLPTASP